LHPELYIANVLVDFLSNEQTLFIKENGTLVSNILSIGLNVGMNFLGTNFLVFKVPDPDKLFD
jgi:hypothetical protein